MSNLFNPDEGRSPSSDPPKRRFVYTLPLLLITALGALLWWISDGHWGQQLRVSSFRARLVPPSAMDRFLAEEKHTPENSNNAMNASSGASLAVRDQEGDDPQGSVLFQAAGWLKASPYATMVTALSSGVVSKLHVEEGQAIKKGQLLAELDDADAKIAVSKAKAKLEIQEQKILRSQSQLKEWQAGLGEQQAMVDVANIRMNSEKASLTKWENSSEGISELLLDERRRRFDELQAAWLSSKARLMQWQWKIKTGEQELQLAQKERELRSIEWEDAKLQWQRTKIYAPFDGIIEDLYARVGRKQMLGSDNPLSTTVAKMYAQGDLLADIDVPLMDVFKVHKNQRVWLSIEGLDQNLKGVVRQKAGEADPQKNTLRVRVQLLNAPTSVRPGMLTQAKFMGKAATMDSKLSSPSSPPREDLVLLPKQALLQGRVLIIDEDNRLLWQELEFQNSPHKDYLWIRSGLYPGQRVVANPKREYANGQRVKWQDITWGKEGLEKANPSHGDQASPKQQMEMKP
jgi:multidrug efflux pump subunit AcrA (membrane-fusion protein)